MKKLHLLGFIFISFFKIALFVIGGGFAMIPVIERVFVKEHNLLTNEDILDMVTITQTMPGLIAVNSAIFVGHKLAGYSGVIIAVLAVVIPSLVIISIIAAIFSSLDFNNLHILKAFSFVRACIAALFCVMAYNFGKRILKSKFDYILALFFIILLILKVSSVIVILVSIPIGFVYVFLKRYIKGKEQNE